MTPSLTPRDDFFRAGSDWTVIRAPPPFALRHTIVDGRMFCETIATFPGKRDDAVALFRGPWTWWAHGRSLDFQEREDGSTWQVLVPVWWYTTRIVLHIQRPGAVPDADAGTRLPLYLSRHFVGLATIDVIDDGQRRVRIRGRFHGVENRVPFIPTHIAASVHCRAEAGNLLFPFPRGTGWPGLARAIESPSPDSRVSRGAT